MYESPIAIITTEYQSSIDDEVLRVTQKIGVDVNKDELIKALKYDRGQYEKGYADGKAARKKGKWVRDEFGSKCPCCELYAYRDEWGDPWESNFCPNCGAELEGGE